MSKVLNDLLKDRAVHHASAGFSHILDFEAGSGVSLTEAFIQAASIPKALDKLGVSVGYDEGGLLSVAKVQSYQRSLENAHQKNTFVVSFKAELDQFSKELWNYFERSCLAVEAMERQG